LESFLFPLSRAGVVASPQYAVVFPLVRVACSLRRRKAATRSMISGHRFGVLREPTAVRVVLPRQRRLSMPVFSPPRPIPGLCTGLLGFVPLRRRAGIRP